MKKTKKLCVYGIGLLLLLSFVGYASADGSNVTVTWIIPADLSIAITYPTGESQIVFEPGSKTFSEEQARNQHTGAAGMNIENDGNTALQINFTFADAWYDAGLANFNCSVDSYNNATLKVYWTNSNETANHTVVANLAISASEDFWFWSTGTDCTESAIGEDTETLEVWYTNV